MDEDFWLYVTLFPTLCDKEMDRPNENDENDEHFLHHTLDSIL